MTFETRQRTLGVIKWTAYIGAMIAWTYAILQALWKSRF